MGNKEILSVKDLPEGVLGTTISFVAHPLEPEFEALRESNPTIRKAVDRHKSIVSKNRGLEIANMTPELNGLWHEDPQFTAGEGGKNRTIQFRFTRSNSQVDIDFDKDIFTTTSFLFTHDRSEAKVTNIYLKISSGKTMATLKPRTEKHPAVYGKYVHLQEVNKHFHRTGQDDQATLGQSFRAWSFRGLPRSALEPWGIQPSQARVLWEGHDGELI